MYDLRTDLDVDTMNTVRSDLYRIHGDPAVAQHVRDGAAALINYYGAILDQRYKRLVESAPDQ